MSKILVGYNSSQIIIQHPYGPPLSIPTAVFQRFNNSGTLIESKDDNQFTAFQRHVRILDMMKDGKTETPTVPHAVICDAFEIQPNQCPTFADLTNIKHGIQEANKGKIKKSTWLHANEITSKITMLTTRRTYKESGINPAVVINKPVYQSNIATEIIDPLGRSYPPDTTVELFPLQGTTLLLEESFLRLFGFYDCSVRDKRDGNVHRYAIKIRKDYVITGEKTHHENNDDPWDWFAGNRTKNQYLVNHQNDHPTNRALLTIKEMGDVLQVLMMLIGKAMKPGLHTLVTGDEIVFILCIQLGLECILYHHQPKAEHSIRYFRSEYTLEGAKEDWESARKAIHDHNQAVINGIRHLQDFPKSHTIDVKTMTTRPGFNFCKAFYDHLLEDMEQIQQALQKRSFMEGGMTEKARIAGLNEAIKRMKREYTLNKPFTFNRAKENTDYTKSVTFNPGAYRYTETAPPDVSYQLHGYKGIQSVPFYQLYIEHYMKENPEQCPHPDPSKVVPKKRYMGGNGNNNRMVAATASAASNSIGNQMAATASAASNSIGNQMSIAGNLLDVFALDFPPVMYRLTENDHEDSEYTGKPREIDLHDRWKNTVRTLFARMCGTNTDLYQIYEDDLFWHLYEYCYANEVVVPADVDEGSILYTLIVEFVATIRDLQEKYQTVELSSSSSSSSNRIQYPSFSGPQMVQPRQEPRRFFSQQTHNVYPSTASVYTPYSTSFVDPRKAHSQQRLDPRKVQQMQKRRTVYQLSQMKKGTKNGMKTNNARNKVYVPLNKTKKKYPTISAKGGRKATRKRKGRKGRKETRKR